jgi:hypothetical protein
MCSVLSVYHAQLAVLTISELVRPSKANYLYRCETKNSECEAQGRNDRPARLAKARTDDVPFRVFH